jgi:ABC-type multidrug transport system fused ATPase/permease subunit
MIVAQFAVGQVLMSMIWFFLIFIWIMLLFRVFADIFRSQDLSGVMKTIWLLFVILTPYLGVFVYLIARGGKMAENEVRSMQAQEAATREYIRAAATVSPADELARLADLKDRGVIDDKEFAAMKAKVLA